MTARGLLDLHRGEGRYFTDKELSRIAVMKRRNQGAERAVATESRSGLSVVRLSRRSPKVTTTTVDALREEMP